MADGGLQWLTIEGPLVCVHLPKTAGSSLGRLFYRQTPFARFAVMHNWLAAVNENPAPNFADANRRTVENLERLTGRELSPALLIGHVPFRLARDHLPDSTAFVTVLRDPVERIISTYSYLRSRPDPNLYHGGRFPDDLTLDRAVDEGYIPDNLQTRLLSDPEVPHGQCSGEMLAEAKRNLDAFLEVGLTERFPEFLILIRRRTGLRDILPPRLRTTPHRQRRSEFQRRAIEAVERHNELDLELYDHARSMFEKRLAEEDLELELLALRRALGDEEDIHAAAANHDPRLVEAMAELLRKDSDLAQAQRWAANLRAERRQLRHQYEEIRGLQSQLGERLDAIEEIFRQPERRRRFPDNYIGGV